MLIIGIVIGFLVSFITLKSTINKSGCGELKMCKQHCPYYTSVELNRRKEEEGDDNDK